MLSSDNVIRTGFYRKWDSGILEYDVIFALGAAGEKRTVNGTEYEVLHANTLVIENDAYYNSESDADIFAQSGTSEVYVNGTVQTGLNGVCDTFAGHIAFPMPFKDANYMIFGSDTVAQSRNTGNQSIDSGCNSMVYTNRTESGMDALVVIQPKTQGATACLLSNSFHCQVIGRWK